MTSDVGDAFVVLCPEILFLDLQGAINASGIFRRGLNFDYLKRPRSGDTKYAYKALDVSKALLAAGHRPFQPPPPPQAQEPAPAATAAGRARGHARTGGVASARWTIGFIYRMIQRLRRVQS